MVDVVIFDTETTGLPLNGPPDDPKQAYPVQLAWIAADTSFNALHERVVIIAPPRDIYMHPRAEATHGKSLEYCWRHGMPFEEALALFQQDCHAAVLRGAYNIKFDDRIMGNAYMRHFPDDPVVVAETLPENKMLAAQAAVFGPTIPYCVMEHVTAKLAVPGGNGGYRNLKLSQVYRRLTGLKMLDAHDALGDVRGTLTVARELMSMEPIQVDPTD